MARENEITYEEVSEIDNSLDEYGNYRIKQDTDKWYRIRIRLKIIENMVETVRKELSNNFSSVNCINNKFYNLRREFSALGIDNFSLSDWMEISITPTPFIWVISLEQPPTIIKNTDRDVFQDFAGQIVFYYPYTITSNNSKLGYFENGIFDSDINKAEFIFNVSNNTFSWKGDFNKGCYFPE